MYEGTYKYKVYVRYIRYMYEGNIYIYKVRKIIIVYQNKNFFLSKSTLTSGVTPILKLK